ncbi:riboflavin kinase [uncultured Citricoccus sp.]|uniref:riboflavin kinase n=1 Tax=uncultured Citricoccus sp. TaxID=614031 RepID=UPI0034142C74
MRVFEGIVEHGDAVGRELGFPTANLPIDDHSLEDGVWVGLVQCREKRWRPATVSIGRRSTFYSEGGPRLLETHILDFDGHLYGLPMRVRLVAKIRTQASFSTLESLIDQMHRDVELTRRWFDAPLPCGNTVRWITRPVELV